MKLRTILQNLFLLSFLLFNSFGILASESKCKNYAFTNGNWFNGKKFVRKNMYSSGGIFVKKKPARVDKEFDFTGKYIIAPFGEAHNHWVEPNSTEKYINNYLKDGVFYVKDQANSPYIFSQFKDKVNLPTSIDYITALQGFTESGGHPYQIYLQFQQFGIFPKEWKEQDFDGKALMLVDNAKDLDERWSSFLKGKPSFVKVFLLFSEQYKERKNNPKYKYNRGLNPKLIPAIVTRAQRSGLSVSAHISSSTDFHNAAVSGVDEISHTPLVEFDENLGKENFLLKESDVRLVAKRGICVITTISWLDELRSENAEKAKEALDEIVIPNLRLLKKHKVKLLVGSDQFRQTPIGEIMLLASTGVFANLELLKMATETTPRAIFPKRRIGFLRKGYEASFLVLNQNPLIDAKNLKNIHLRFKQGNQILVKK